MFCTFTMPNYLGKWVPFVYESKLMDLKELFGHLFAMFGQLTEKRNAAYLFHALLSDIKNCCPNCCQNLVLLLHSHWWMGPFGTMTLYEFQSDQPMLTWCYLMLSIYGSNYTTMVKRCTFNSGECQHIGCHGQQHVSNCHYSWVDKWDRIIEIEHNDTVNWEYRMKKSCNLMNQCS